MFNLSRKKKKETILEYLSEKAKELEVKGYVSLAIVSSDGLTIFSKSSNKNYKVKKIYPYAVKVFEMVEAFHERAKPGSKAGKFKEPRIVVYKTDTNEETFIAKGFSEMLDIYLIYIFDPDLTLFFSTDRTMKKLIKWLREASRKLDRIMLRKELSDDIS